MHAHSFAARLGLLGCLFCVTVFGAAPAEEAGAPALHEDFDGKLTLDWKQVRPEPDHQSLTKSPGNLTITTQYGSIHRTGRPVPAKNLFLIDIPEERRNEFVVTTVLDHFRPQMPYNQAGLIVYQGDDDYVKFVCEFSSKGRTMLNAIVEREGESEITNFWVPLDSDRLWLRVIKRGKVYELLTSDDGEKFTTCADLTWEGTASQAGILAKNGNTRTAAEVDACFDLFDVRPLNEAEKANVSQAQRAALQGQWKVVAAEFNGKKMAGAAIASVAFQPGVIILGEQTREINATCLIDAASEPKTLKVYARSGTNVSLLNWAWKLEGDELMLCTVPKPGAAPPDSFETKEGDGRMLLRLQRAAGEG